MEGEDDNGEDDPGDGLADTPTLGEWAKLRRQVFEASFMRENFNSTVPLVKIGRFDAIVWIGEGGWGTVFKARDPGLGRLVALKLCRTRTPELIQAIETEAQALAQLDHPNIVPVHELGQHDGAPFFVMPYIAGKNAAEFARRKPRPTWRQTVRLYCGVAKGLAAAHRRGIVHGDIKPSNFLLDPDDFPRIADFGLARRVIEDADESEHEGLLHRGGTIYYAAPEVLKGGHGDAHSDQFSFFVALAQTLEGGALPFKGETSGELLEDIKRTEVQFTDPLIPRALIALVRIGLSEDPSERLPNMGVVEAELERILQSTPDESSVIEPPVSDEQAPDEPPEFEPAPAVSEPDELTLMPLGVGATAPTSKPKLGSYLAALLLGMGCAAVGWVGGRGQVEVAPNDPVPLPTMPCALGDDAEGSSVDIDPRVLPACTYIRQGLFVDADRYWTTMYDSRRKAILNRIPNLEDSPAKLAADTEIVVQTFRDQAEQLANELGKQEKAKVATSYAKAWTVRVAEALALGDASTSTPVDAD